MTNATTHLPDDIDFLKRLLLEKIESENENVKLVAQKEKCIEQKDKRIQHLEQVVHYLKLKQYGRSSERHTGDSPQEELLFNEAEQCEDACAPDSAAALETPPDTVTSEPGSPAKKRGRRALPENLRRERVYHDLAPHATRCTCGCDLKAIDDVISEQLAVIPAELYVIQHCRKKYVCPSCKTHAPVTAPLPPQPLPQSNASPELLAHIAVSKFLDGLPFYRQEKIWERLDIHLPRATQANWMMGCGDLVQPLANLLFDYHGQGDLLFIDETPVQVLHEKDKPPEGDKYFWLVAGGPPDRRVYRYHYHPSRGSAVAMDLLSGFKGTVMSDDWAVYGLACEKLQLT
jgi:transposase